MFLPCRRWPGPPVPCDPLHFLLLPVWRGRGSEHAAPNVPLGHRPMETDHALPCKGVPSPTARSWERRTSPPGRRETRLGKSPYKHSSLTNPYLPHTTPHSDLPSLLAPIAETPFLGSSHFSPELWLFCKRLHGPQVLTTPPSDSPPSAPGATQCLSRSLCTLACCRSGSVRPTCRALAKHRGV